jgi:hypothetical protein
VVTLLVCSEDHDIFYLSQVQLRHSCAVICLLNSQSFAEKKVSDHEMSILGMTFISSTCPDSLSFRTEH